MCGAPTVLGKTPDYKLSVYTPTVESPTVVALRHALHGLAVST